MNHTTNRSSMQGAQPLLGACQRILSLQKESTYLSILHASKLWQSSREQYRPTRLSRQTQILEAEAMTVPDCLLY